MSLLNMSFSGTIFIIAVIVVRTVLLNKLPKRTFLILWEIAFFKLLVPYSIPSMFSIHTLISKVLFPSTFFGGTDTNAIIFAWVQGQNATSQEIKKLSSDMISLHSIWFAIWCIGMIALTLFFTVSYFRCLNEFQTSLPICNDFVEQWLKEHSIKRSISVRQSDRILTPLTYGILRPVILIPQKTDWENTQQLLYVLSHEHIHICHFDILKKLIATVVLCIHWFNPMVWVMYILFNRDVELTCDEGIVRQFGEKSKAVYSLTLINMEEKQSGLLPFCNNFSKNASEERITAIMKIKKVTILSFATACLIICGFVAVFATSAQAKSTVPSLDRQESAFTAPNMQPYGKWNNYYYLSADYVLNGETIYKAGYYEAIKLVDGCETCIFIPIDPISYERLPSNNFSDGTIIEIDGKDYVIHKNNNEYTAVLKDQHYIYYQF